MAGAGTWVFQQQEMIYPKYNDDRWCQLKIGKRHDLIDLELSAVSLPKRWVNDQKGDP